MKVLVINLRVDSGCVGRIVTDIYKEAKKQGINYKVAYAKGNDGTIDKNDIIKIGTYKDLYIHALLSRILGSSGTYSKNATKRLIKDIEDFKPDVVHMHGNYGYYVNIELLFNYLSESGIPVISTLHSCWDFTGHCCYYSEIGCEQWKTCCEKCSQKRDYPQSYFIENTKKNYLLKKKLYDSLNRCVIVGPCDWMKKQAQSSFLNKHYIMTIYNGVDLEVFKPTFSNLEYIKNDKTIILCVANAWERRKGLQDVIELSKVIDDKYQLIVVGLQRKQFELFDDNVCKIERTQNVHELASLYTQADVLFNPTYDDNYPTVNLEAIACHTPVVTYNTGGSPDALQNGRFGVVIEKKDYNSLLKYADSIRNKSVEIDFSDLTFIDKRHMIDSYISLYQSIYKHFENEKEITYENS